MDEKVRAIKDVLDVVSERGRSYGPPHEHFSRTVGMINAAFGSLLRRPLEPAEWGAFMILDKIARDQEKAQRDNMLDIIGYAGCVCECREWERGQHGGPPVQQDPKSGPEQHSITPLSDAASAIPHPES
jgi:hypothetical protein